MCDSVELYGWTRTNSVFWFQLYHTLGCYRFILSSLLSIHSLFHVPVDSNPPPPPPPQKKKRRKKTSNKLTKQKLAGICFLTTLYNSLSLSPLSEMCVVRGKEGCVYQRERERERERGAYGEWESVSSRIFCLQSTKCIFGLSVCHLNQGCVSVSRIW